MIEALAMASYSFPHGRWWLQKSPEEEVNFSEQTIEVKYLFCVPEETIH